MLETKDMKFTPITMDDKELIEDILINGELYKDSPASEINFESLYCWRESEQIKKCIIDEGVILSFLDNDDLMAFYPPLVKNKEDFVPAMCKIAEYCVANGLDIYIERLTRQQAEAASDINVEGCSMIECRSHFEYLYNPSDLINLTGKNYKSKRNFLHGFMAEYDYEFLSYDKSMKDEILLLVKKWGKGCESHDFNVECSAIRIALDNLEALNLHCDVIKVDGKIVAFAVGYINHANVGVVMFEKADVEYRGTFQAINNFFATKYFENCVCVNRQEDLGLEGMRTSKSSYHPIGFAEKFSYTNKPEVEKIFNV
jgi:hypothetical protein